MGLLLYYPIAYCDGSNEISILGADPIYVDAFLLTYRYALPSAQLLAELIELYPKDNYMELSQQTFDLRIRYENINFYQIWESNSISLEFAR